MTTPDPNDLNAWFPRDERGQMLDSETGNRLGVIVGGSISRGLAVKLDPSVNVEDLAVGRYVVVRGERKRFFCMINDITLDTTNPAVESDPPDISDPFLRDVYSGTVAYSTVTVTPMLIIDDEEGTLPVKTIPGHFKSVRTATTEDVDAVFGTEGGENFNVGSPLELRNTNINLNLRRLVERSVGVFGKSGTGKSFLTRVLLAGAIKRGIGVSVIFDMHNDYGWEIQNESGYAVKGLRQLFPSKVSILTLDADSSKRRGATYDFEVRLGFNEIEPEDIAMLKATMNLSDTMIDAAYTLRKMWGRNWVRQLIQGTPDDLDFIVHESNVGARNAGGLAASSGALRALGISRAGKRGTVRVCSKY